MRVIPLQSGSAGNCCFVEANGVRLLLDAGLSATRVARRLTSAGVELGRIDAIVVTHDHSDHVGAAGPLCRRLGAPLCITEATWAASRHAIREVPAVRHFVAGDEIGFASTLGTLTVRTIPTPHDAADGCVFVVDDGRSRLAVMTDFGHAFPALQAALADCDAALLESNYDAQLLSAGGYPVWLKRRIAGGRGHISNAQAAALLRDHGRRLRWCCLGHLSQENNRPELALATARAAVGDLPLHLAPRDDCGPLLET